MNKQVSLSTSEKLQASGLVVAAIGILTQIFSGVSTATIPVGAIVMVILAGLLFLRLWRWMPTLGAVVATLILIGAFVAPGLTKRLSDPAEIGPFIGTILQLAGLATAIISGAIYTIRLTNNRNTMATNSSTRL